METKQLDRTLPDPEQCNRLLKSLFQIADVMNARKLTPSSMMDRVLQVVLEYLGVEQGSLMVLEKNRLVVRAATRPEIIGHRQSLTDDSVAAWVVRHAKPLFIPDIAKDKRFAKREGIYKKDSLLSAPVIHKDQVIGVINASDRTGGMDLLKDDITYLLYFSSFILWTLIQENLRKKITAQRNTLKKRNSELRRQEEMRSYLNRMLMHDLKTPLSEVVANLDILSYSISGEQKEFLESAQLGCDRAVRMVANLVTTDKIADGKQQLLYEETDCRSLLGEAISSIKGLARIKHIDLRQQEAAPDFPMITVDRTLILRVLQNLLTNSLSYTEPDSVITAGFNTTGKNHIEFFVQDQGPGIAPAQQETIFDKYARISSKQDALVGTGLGLHFCKLAVELHNGRIGVQSAEGKGSRFFFKLPIK
ncbi:MAG: ATP-binding protein [Thermodesulfobacteriota bacterium]